LNDKDLSSYLRACLFQGDHYSTWIILLSAEWAARTETLQTTVRGLAKSTRIINLSNGAWLDLPDLIRDFAATQASRQNIVLASPKQPATTFTRH
jgi:hypothetical protein